MLKLSHRCWSILVALVVALPLLSMGPTWAAQPEDAPDVGAPLPWVVEPTQRLNSPAWTDRKPASALPAFIYDLTTWPWRAAADDWFALPAPPPPSARELLLYFHTLKLEGG